MNGNWLGPIKISGWCWPNWAILITSQEADPKKSSLQNWEEDRKTKRERKHKSSGQKLPTSGSWNSYFPLEMLAILYHHYIGVRMWHLFSQYFMHETIPWKSKMHLPPLIGRKLSVILQTIHQVQTPQQILARILEFNKSVGIKHLCYYPLPHTFSMD